MAEAYSLLEFLQQLSLDDGLHSAFTADPQATLAEHGLAGLTAEDVHDAAVLVEDTRTADFSLDHTLAPDPAAGFLDSFLSGDPAYLPSDLGESADVTDVADVHTDAPDDVSQHVAGFGTGHTAGHEATDHHLATDGIVAEQHVTTFEGYGEHYADLDEHSDPDLDDLFGEHADPAGGEHHTVGTEPPAH